MLFGRRRFLHLLAILLGAGTIYIISIMINVEELDREILSKNPDAVQDKERTNDRKISAGLFP